MKIHGIALIKDESDIIQQTLESASKWCDYIYVYDNGSVDDTWEKVLRLAETNTKIIPYRKKSQKFYDGLRGEIFDYYKANSQSGDWWCRIDADEFYIDEPKLFLSKVPDQYSFVCSASFGFYFTDLDYKIYQENPDKYSDDIPIEQKIKYYSNKWSEMRCVRQHKNLDWPIDKAWPINVWQTYPIRIRTKNYRYRSPQQIQKRLDARREAMENGMFRHELMTRSSWMKSVSCASPKSDSDDRSYLLPSEVSWKDRIAESKLLYFDNQDGDYISDEQQMPSIGKLEKYYKSKMKSGKFSRNFLKNITSSFLKRLRKFSGIR